MRIPRRTLAFLALALSLPCSRAQDAVLVLTPSATTAVLAGNGVTGFAGDGASAAAARLAGPSSLARDAAGNLYIADTRNHRIRCVASNGIITTVAGTGSQGFSGDGGPAAQAQLDSPSAVAFAANGTLYIADTRNHRVRAVSSTGIIRTIAGDGRAAFGGDGDTATTAHLSSPRGLDIGLSGDLYIADTGNHRIRHIGRDGTISTVAGDGAQGASPDGATATMAHLNGPTAVSVRPDGSVLIADRGNNRIVVLQTNGILHTVSTGAVTLRRPAAVATNAFGDTLIADTGNYRIAEVSGSGTGSVLGSGRQGALDASAAPVSTALGAPSSVIASSGAEANTSQLTAIDRDSSRVIRLDLPRLGFADTVVATASTPRTLQLRNSGTADLAVTSVVAPAPFTIALSSSCGTAPFHLAGNSSCGIDLQFTPAATGEATGMLQVIVENALPQRVALTGLGLRSGTALASSTSLQASAGVTYAGMPLTLTAAVLGGAPTAASGTVTFLDGGSELGTGSLNPAAQATLSVATLSAGNHTLTARYNGDARYQPSTSAETSITVANPPDFTISTGGTNRIVLPSGSAGALALALQPVSGVLNQTVTIGVDGLPSGSAITITPIPVTLSSDPVSVSVAFKLPVKLSSVHSRGVWLAVALPSLLVVSRRRRSLLLGAALSFSLNCMVGCGGGYLSGNSVASQSASSTYAVTVTASCPSVTGATLTHAASFTVVVQ